MPQRRFSFDWLTRGTPWIVKVVRKPLGSLDRFSAPLLPNTQHPPRQPAISSVACVPRVNFNAGDAQLWRSLGLHAGLVAGYGAEQPVRLAVDPVGEVEDIGTAVVAAHPELDRPQAARG